LTPYATQRANSPGQQRLGWHGELRVVSVVSRNHPGRRSRRGRLQSPLNRSFDRWTRNDDPGRMARARTCKGSTWFAPHPPVPDPPPMSDPSGNLSPIKWDSNRVGERDRMHSRKPCASPRRTLWRGPVLVSVLRSHSPDRRAALLVDARWLAAGKDESCQIGFRECAG